MLARIASDANETANANPMSAIHWLGLIVTAALFLYLMAALLWPERF
jgi:K+-transporting ATPase KdpF subunit